MKNIPQILKTKKFYKDLKNLYENHPFERYLCLVSEDFKSYWNIGLCRGWLINHCNAFLRKTNRMQFKNTDKVDASAKALFFNGDYKFRVENKVQLREIRKEFLDYMMNKFP